MAHDYIIYINAYMHTYMCYMNMYLMCTYIL